MSTENQTQTETEIEAQTETTEEQTETNPNAEAARYRRQLRATETERDTLRDQLGQARRQIAESACGLTHPAALWAAGVDPSSLFDEDGQLDQTALDAAVTQAAELVGAETRQARANRSYWEGGPFGHGSSSGSRDRDSFSSAFRP